jgi:predicted membrane-bound spermidine synthase
MCAVQWLVAAVLILPQSILLGTTFPLMTAGVLRLGTHAPGRRISLFYFLNSLGAVVGVLCATFLLIPQTGLPGTLMTAGLLNILVAIVAYFAAKPGAIPITGEAQAGAPASESKVVGVAGVALVVAALTGLSSFIYEIVWIRMLSLVMGSSVHSFELMLAAFILGLALGGACVRSRIDRFTDLFGVLAVVQVLMGVLAVATIPLYSYTFEFFGWMMRSLSRSDGGYVLYVVGSQLVALGVMLPATVLAGMTLPLITTALLRGPLGERSIGFVYSANTVGAIVGVGLTAHVLLPMLGVKGALVAGAMIDVALGIWLLVARPVSVPAIGRIAMIAAGPLAIAAVALFSPISPDRTASGVFRHGVSSLDPRSEILFYRDGKTATVAVARIGSDVAIRTNGKTDAAVAPATKPASGDEYTMALLAMLPLAYVPEARHAAVIGFGSGMSTATLLGSPILERVDTIEIERQMVEGARLFGAAVDRAFTDPRSRIVVDDAKSYFARSRERYDLILSEPSNPWVSGVSSLFTVEFYRRIKEHLREGGVLAQWIQTYEISDPLVGTVLRAIDSEFADYAVYDINNGDLVVVASNRPLPTRLDPSLLGFPGLSDVAKRVGVRSVDELEVRRVGGRAILHGMLPFLSTGVNSDFYPLLEHKAPRERFMMAKANALAKLSVSAVPVVEMLEGQLPGAPPVELVGAEHPGTRRLAAVAARAAYRYLMHSEVEASMSSTEADLWRHVATMRVSLWQCAALPPDASVLDSLLVLAGELNPHLRRDEAAALWDVIEAAPCFRRLSGEERRWVALFRAVGLRSTQQMAVLGKELLGSDRVGISLREYAMVAAAAALLAQKRHSEARSLLDAELPKLRAGQRGQPWVLALLGYTGVAERSR